MMKLYIYNTNCSAASALASSCVKQTPTNSRYAKYSILWHAAQTFL